MYAEILTERWIWLIGSLCIAIVASWITWGFRKAEEHKDNPGSISYQVLRLIYAVGIPATALLWRGALTTKGLGLQPPPWAPPPTSNPHHLADWVSDIGWTICIMSGAWIIIASGEQRANDNMATSCHRNLGIALREAVYHQVHWAFYREPFTLLWGINIGTWAGLLPVTIEALASPKHWTSSQTTAQRRNILIRAALAIVSALMYLKTQNLWLAIAADTGLGWLLGWQDLTTSPKSKQQLEQSEVPT